MKNRRFISNVIENINKLINEYRCEVNKVRKIELVSDILCLESLLLGSAKEEPNITKQLSEFGKTINNEISEITAQNSNYENIINNFLSNNLENILKILDNIIENTKIPLQVITPEKATKKKVLMQLDSFTSKKFKSFMFNELQSKKIFYSKTTDKNVITTLAGVQYYIKTLDQSFYKIQTNKCSSYSDLYVTLHELSHGYLTKNNSSIVDYSVLKEVFPLYNELKLNFFYSKQSATYNTSLLYEYETLVRLKNIALKIKKTIFDCYDVNSICRFNPIFNNMLLEFTGQIIALHIFNEYLDHPLNVDQKMNYLCENIGKLKDSDILAYLDYNFDKIAQTTNVNKVLCKSKERAKL